MAGGREREQICQSSARGRCRLLRHPSLVRRHRQGRNCRPAAFQGTRPVAGERRAPAGPAPRHRPPPPARPPARQHSLRHASAFSGGCSHSNNLSFSALTQDLVLLPAAPTCTWLREGSPGGAAAVTVAPRGLWDEARLKSRGRPSAWGELGFVVSVKMNGDFQRRGWTSNVSVKGNEEKQRICKKRRSHLPHLAPDADAFQVLQKTAKENCSQPCHWVHKCPPALS
ncbi:uncharacterized protein LOC142028798 [Buteo buteo]|uniref:uncharacterized protein LOC142028798 n=1 Tax=Buteo buteo TaxID=30397 RepID=UPI003EBE48DC